MKCKYGITFKTCIDAGAKNSDSGIGVYAGSPHSYKVFNKFFDLVIQDYHGHAPEDFHITEMTT